MISHLEDTTTPIPTKMTELEKAADLWTQRADDLESRLRRNNISILGLPEHTEGQHPCDFADHWLKEIIPNARISPLFAVEEAHRIPPRPPPPGDSPRPLLVQMLNSKDRDAALQAARKMPEHKYNGAYISLFPNFFRSIAEN